MTGSLTASAVADPKVAVYPVAMLEDLMMASFDRAAKKGARIDPATGYPYLVYSKNGYYLGGALLLMTVVVIVGMAISVRDETWTENWWVPVMFSSLTVFWFNELRVRVGLEPNGLRLRSPWRGERSMSYQRIRKVHYSSTWRWFMVDSPGERIRVSAYLVGVPYFIHRLREERPDLDLGPALKAYELIHGALPKG